MNPLRAEIALHHTTTTTCTLACFGRDSRRSASSAGERNGERLPSLIAGVFPLPPRLLQTDSSSA